MRTLTDAHRLQSPSIPELTRGLRDVADALKDAGYRHDKRKLSHGPLLNAVIAWYLAQTEAERERIAQQGLAVLEAILSRPYVHLANSSPLGSAILHDRNPKKPIGKDKPIGSR